MAYIATSEVELWYDDRNTSCGVEWDTQPWTGGRDFGCVNFFGLCGTLRLPITVERHLEEYEANRLLHCQMILHHVLQMLWVLRKASSIT